LLANKRLPVIAISAAVIVGAVILLVALPLLTSQPKSNFIVYPQIKYPTQLLAGEAGSFYPNVLEQDSNGKPYRNLPYLLEWSFGDGSGSISQRMNSSIPNDTFGLNGSTYEVKHTYAHVGSYPVTLKATNSQGSTGTITIELKVLQ
jgi:hypothetical protein